MHTPRARHIFLELSDNVSRVRPRRECPSTVLTAQGISFRIGPVNLNSANPSQNAQRYSCNSLLISVVPSLLLFLLPSAPALRFQHPHFTHPTKVHLKREADKTN
ncbi:hypothetical protein FA13DRAFT_1735278 [Coprinellus micaceus]|uniref:Uncharacterized protein n=1 Tax=Coprinellus micaceus TaxID=71717 RepID=A0A4Y7T3J9_COPMI|nr:hypothetical protein FA13DRAFT_1735278 [Coprinellus micaceus]